MLALDTNVRGVVAYRPIGQVQHSKDIRKRLVQTALELFASRGYYHTSIAEILRNSGCRRGTLYYYFSSKEELGHAVIDESFRLFSERGAASRLRTKEHPIDRMLKLLDDLPSAIRLETTGSLTAGIAARMASVHEGFRQRLVARVAPLYEEFERMIATGVADGQIADSVNPHQLTHFAMVVSHGLQMARQLGQEQLLPDGARGWLRDYLNSLRR